MQVPSEHGGRAYGWVEMAAGNPSQRTDGDRDCKPLSQGDAQEPGASLVRGKEGVRADDTHTDEANEERTDHLGQAPLG
jgi:hypothetical protein